METLLCPTQTRIRKVCISISIKLKVGMKNQKKFQTILKLKILITDKIMYFQYQSSALIMRITLLFLLCISKSIFNCTNQSLLDDQIKNDNHLQSETKKKETLDFFEESENATDKVLLTHTSISRNITMNYKDIDCNYNLEGESSIFYNFVSFFTA